MSEHTVTPGEPAQWHIAETGEFGQHDVTVVHHPADEGVALVDHGWTAPQLAALRAGTLSVGCPDCVRALVEEPAVVADHPLTHEPQPLAESAQLPSPVRRPANPHMDHAAPEVRP